MPREPRETRAALLDAAEEILVTHGLAKSTVEQITERAGVAKGTFYLYFTSKDEAVGAVQQQLWERLAALCADAVARLATDDWWTVADELVETVIDFDLAHREWHRLVARVPPVDSDTEQGFIDILAAGILTGMERGACHSDDPAMTATLLYRAVEGTAHQVSRSDGPVDRDRVVRAIQGLIRKALAPVGVASAPTTG
jgi:AcrR family transcriptional regulator